MQLMTEGVGVNDETMLMCNFVVIQSEWCNGSVSVNGVTGLAVDQSGTCTFTMKK